MRALLAISLLFTLSTSTLSADYFRDGGFLAGVGILESIRMEPRLPAEGDGFTVNLKGSWPEVIKTNSLSGEKYPCYAAPEVEKVVVSAGNQVQLYTNLQHDESLCDQPPAQWDFDVAIPASAWDAVNQDGYLLIEHLLASGINMLTGIDQVFDMRYGTHVVPAWLGSGFWVSEARPYEGIMIEQQGSRVLFYGLGYDRDARQGDDGEPVWLMNSGEMRGGSTLGRAYRFDWPFDQDGWPVEMPTTSELLTENDSGSIIVNDYNHVRAFTKTTGNVGRYEDYQRLVFGIDRSRLPVYVPPLEGGWTLYGFSDKKRVYMASFQLLGGEPLSKNEYVFASAGGDWSGRCNVTPPGDGECQFVRDSDETEFDFPVSAFQGNLAQGNLGTAIGASLTGILVRDPWQLPVEDAD